MKSLIRRIPFVQDGYRSIRRSIARRRAGQSFVAYFSSATQPRLHLGCGGNVLPGWLNTDAFTVPTGVVYLDVTEPFPLPDKSLDYILTEHMIEHITLRSARAMVAECRRVLRPGGVLRVSTPALDRYLALYGTEELDTTKHIVKTLTDDWIAPGFYAAKDYMPRRGIYDPVFVINDLFRNYEHQFLYDERNLTRLLRDVGFESITSHRTGESHHPVFQGVETHVDYVTRAMTLVLEAKVASPN